MSLFYELPPESGILIDKEDLGPLRRGLDRCTEPRGACANDEDISRYLPCSQAMEWCGRGRRTLLLAFNLDAFLQRRNACPHVWDSVNPHEAGGAFADAAEEASRAVIRLADSQFFDAGGVQS